MRLLQLKVQRFRCVEHAEVAFGPGFNVLHGPNDLGKTTLVDAIRAALLVPHASATTETFAPWQGGEAPEVTLVFETEPQRIYRVRKVFGSTGKSQLEVSKDGVSYGPEAQGRNVEAKLRALLQWGIPSPGGKGGIRGIPESFLTRVLLAGQPEVTNVLRISLKDDKDDTGRVRITTALEALAEDELFKSILQRTMQKVGEAFSATGKKKGGKGSVWIDLRDRINETDEKRREWDKKAQQNASVRQSVDELEEACTELRQIRDAAQMEHAHKEQVWKSQQRVEGVRSRLGEAEGVLAARKAKHQAVADAEVQADVLRVEAEACEHSVAQAQKKLEAANLAKDASRSQLKQLESEDSAKERELACGRLEKAKIELQVKEEGLFRQRELAEQIGAAERSVEQTTQGIASTKQSVAAIEKKLEEGKKARDEALTQLKLLQVAGALREHDVVTSQLAEAEQAAATEARLRGDVAAKRAEAQKLGKEVAARAVPDAASLGAIRTLRRELEVAEAKLAVGLAARVVPASTPFALNVVVDGGAPEQRSLDGSAEVVAERQLALMMPGVAEIVVSAGKEADRREARELRARWDNEVKPVLVNAAADSVEALEAACEQVRATQATIREVERTAAETEARANVEAERATRADELKGRLEKLASELEPHRREDIERAAAPYKKQQQLQAAIDKTKRSVDRMGEELTDWDTDLTRERTRLESQLEQLAQAVVKRDEVSSKLSGAWQQILEDVKEALLSMEGERKKIQAELDAIDETRKAALKGAEAAVEKTEKEAALAKAGAEGAGAAAAKAKEALAANRGRLGALREEALNADVPEAEQVVGAVRSELTTAQEAFAALEAEPLAVDALEKLRTAAERAEAALKDKHMELERARGSLDLSGGERAAERCDELGEVLRQLQARQEELELEYDGWKLLQGALTEAQRQEEAHLGQLLSGPIQRRFSSLTNERYGGLDLGAHLETAGIEAAGALRDVQSLSTGTLEQLSTIFRLCLAEQLETAVVLDDHLSHSHSERLSWFRDTMMDVSRRAQVLVVTCWPEHYVGKRTKGVTSLDLEAVIRRY